MKYPEIESSTNSKTGSYHWFMTLMSKHKHIGEYLNSHEEIDHRLIKSWGEDLFKTSDELITWFHNSHEARESCNIDLIIENLQSLIKNLEDAKSSS